VFKSGIDCYHGAFGLKTKIVRFEDKNAKTYLLLGQLELEAIKVSKSSSLLFGDQFLSPCCLLPFFKDLAFLKGLLNRPTFGRGANLDLEVSQ